MIGLSSDHGRGLLLGFGYIIIFILGLYAGRHPTPLRTVMNSELVSEVSVRIKHFFYRGTKYKSNKVYTHHYELMYDKYLPKYRHLPDVSSLEIGLGCGMSYGAGASAYVWRDHLRPQANIHLIEYNRVCGEQSYKSHGMKVPCHSS
jgi:hypothetical protein